MKTNNAAVILLIKSFFECCLTDLQHKINFITKKEGTQV